MCCFFPNKINFVFLIQFLESVFWMSRWLFYIYFFFKPVSWMLWCLFYKQNICIYFLNLSWECICVLPRYSISSFSSQDSLLYSLILFLSRIFTKTIYSFSASFNYTINFILFNFHFDMVRFIGIFRDYNNS